MDDSECPPPGHHVRPRGDPSLHWSVGVNVLLLVIVSDLEVIHHCTDSVGGVSLHLFHHILIRITAGYIVTSPVPQECGRTLTAVVVLLFKYG
ncbi:hypothetical protein J6590_052168 [Homalodisca vitripennis]|nr:hypothetical protein J6590_052168 [Homalodisca vitripennis]